MKNLIYQYWDGDYNRLGVIAGVNAMKKYAQRIGATYIFEKNPQYAKSLGYNFGMYTPHFGAFKPVLENWEYDNILFTDTDVFPVENLTDNIFEVPFKNIAVCKEEWQTINKPDNLKQTDILWAAIVENEYNIKIPRDSYGNVIIYNSGVVLYSKQGAQLARDNFVSFGEYAKLIKTKGKNLPAFYISDQPYLHAMLMKCEWTELDKGWNSYVHYLHNTKDPRPVIDNRTSSTKFVHIQLRCADDWNEEKLWKITNLPVSEWNL